MELERGSVVGFRGNRATGRDGLRTGECRRKGTLLFRTGTAAHRSPGREGCPVARNDGSEAHNGGSVARNDGRGFRNDGSKARTGGSGLKAMVQVLAAMVQGPATAVQGPATTVQGFETMVRLPAAAVSMVIGSVRLSKTVVRCRNGPVQRFTRSVR